MDDNAFKLKVEIAALHAWPGVEQQYVMDWEARFAGGHTKRANSASPLPPLGRVEEHIVACEAAYADHGQPAIFKLPDFIDPEVDAHLARRGYQVADPTLVMIRDLSDIDTEAEGVPLMGLDSWLPAWSACNGKPAPPPAHRMILETRLREAIYLCVPQGQTHVSCGLGVPEGDLYGVFDICTRPDARRSGHATELMRQLLAAGKASGATTCYLQVVETNAPARALYDALGFTRLYKYWYRVQPQNENGEGR